MTRQLLTLGVVLAAGLLGARLVDRLRRSGGFAEVDGKHQAVYDPSGRYLRCEEFTVDPSTGVRRTVRTVADSVCKGCGGFDGILGCPS